MESLGNNRPGRELVASSGPFTVISPAMGAASLALVIGFSAFTVIDVEAAGRMFGAAGAWIAATLDWYYVGVLNFVLFFAVCVMLSPYGSLRLGGDDERPEFSTFSWVAMLFSAAIGVGPTSPTARACRWRCAPRSIP